MTMFVIADTHFGHEGICKFTDDAGNKIRPWNTAEEMDEEMITLWNETVKPLDKVYHLGDVVINRKALKTLGLLNGKKVLIKGNHDIFRLSEYMEYFYDVRAYDRKDSIIFSHMPVHESCLYSVKGNIHGHTHQRRLDDPRYFCVSAEQTNFKPLEFDYIKHYFDTLKGINDYE